MYVVSSLLSGTPEFQFEGNLNGFLMIFLWVLSALGCASGDLRGVILAFVVGSGGLCGCFRGAWGSVQALGVASFWPTRLPGVLNEGAAVSWEALCVSCSSFFKVVGS